MITLKEEKELDV